MNKSIAIGPATILLGNAADSLARLPDDSVDVMMTSPPFFRLRSYLKADDPAKASEIGSEDTPEAFLDRLMLVFDQCRRVLKPSGALWVEFGDSYADDSKWGGSTGSKHVAGLHGDSGPGRARVETGIGAGELMNIPHRFAEAMRSRGWRWRSTCIWVHRSAMPESVAGWRWERCKVKVANQKRDENTKVGSNRADMRPSPPHPDNGIKTVPAAYEDCPGCPKCSATNGYVLRKGQWRCTTGHSYVFMFAKTDEYFMDATVAAEPAASATVERNKYSRIVDNPDEQYAVAHDHEFAGSTRNPRTVWNDITNEPMDMDACLACGRVWRGAEKKRELRKKGKVYVCTCGASEWSSHYAAFPSSLVRKCITPAISKGGCCSKCGMPWSPVVEKTPGSDAPRGWDTADGSHSSEKRHDPESLRRMALNREAARELSGQHDNPFGSTSVLKYLPSCSCNAPSVPQTVLDPFGGTGTVAVVAVEMGQNAVLCELNRNYIPLIDRRLKEVLVPRGQAKAENPDGLPLWSC